MGKIKGFLFAVRHREILMTDLGSYSNRINGHPGVMGSISQVSGSNATRINLDIDKLIAETEKKLPKAIRIITFDNTNDFLFASIHEVVVTLLLAILLVLIVVYLFVQDFRATLIPALGIIVSLIGTFAFIPNRSLEKASCQFLMTAIRKTALYMFGL